LLQWLALHKDYTKTVPIDPNGRFLPQTKDRSTVSGGLCMFAAERADDRPRGYEITLIIVHETPQPFALHGRIVPT
jgi:hypothetical protein